MSNIKEIRVPDLGNVTTAAIIEIPVKVGDVIDKEDALITLESDKASMDIPSPNAGKIKEIKVKVGDKVSKDDVIVLLETETDKEDMKEDNAALNKTAAVHSNKSKKIKSSKTNIQEIRVPDLGNVAAAAIIEIPIKVGDEINKEDALITLESDKASMDIPSPLNGKVKQIKVKVGDKVSKNDVIALFETEATDRASDEGKKQETSQQAKSSDNESSESKLSINSGVPTSLSQSGTETHEDTGDLHAGPGVRRLAREFNLPLQQIKGTGQKGRVTKEDVQHYVKSRLKQTNNTTGLPSPPSIDFTQFGKIDSKPLSRIKKLTGQYLHRNWLLVPHVTQFNDADITELEAFRKAQSAHATKQDVKLTPLAFIMKAAVTALKAFPAFNASLSADGEQLIIKKYYHIGIAVDTPEGLVVPVIRDVNKKSLLELAKELAEVSQRARAQQLSSGELQGSSFTISSLGGIGGTAFTPIVNVPDVAILGVSKAQYKPQYINGEFVPRLMLPLSLSYDHRVIDGAEGARFAVFLAECLSDIRRWLL